MSKIFIKSARLLAVLVLPAVVPITAFSCTSQPKSEPYNFFQTTSSYAGISGYSTGYMPGDNATFTIGLKNPTEQTIQYEFCLLLLDKEGVVAKLIDRRPYTVNPRSSFFPPEQITFPSTLQEGPYRLAFVLSDNFASVTTIWIGSGTPQSGGPWPEIKSCPDQIRLRHEICHYTLRGKEGKIWSAKFYQENPIL